MNYAVLRHVMLKDEFHTISFHVSHPSHANGFAYISIVLIPTVLK